MSATQMTAQDLESLNAELRTLQSAGRAEVIERIKIAREWGDLSENAEYKAAKEDQAHLETRILKLRAQIDAADVVEETSGGETVEFGCAVTFTDEGKGTEQTFKLVSSRDAAPTEGKLSIASPLAAALLHRRIGDVAEVRAPRGTRQLLITAIA
jgi:transcription elongation factor GreA